MGEEVHGDFTGPRVQVWTVSLRARVSFRVWKGVGLPVEHQPGAPGSISPRKQRGPGQWAELELAAGSLNSSLVPVAGAAPGRPRVQEPRVPGPALPWAPKTLGKALPLLGSPFPGCYIWGLD